MADCRLCKKKVADQTGSHLTSCFMVATMVGERDQEVGHVISSEGGDYTLNRKAEPIKEDYIFCKGCEARLAYLEGYFSSEFTNKIGEASYSSNFPKETLKGIDICAPLRVNSVAFHLLIYSVLWRAHISLKPLFLNYQIPEEKAEQIRLMLDTVLPPYKDYKVKGKYKDWLKDLEAVKEDMEFYPYVIMKTFTEDHDATENFIYFSQYEDKPYHHIVNDFVILSFFDDENSGIIEQDFFELSTKYELQNALNVTLDDLKVGILKLEDWRSIRDKLMRIAYNRRFGIKQIIMDCLRIAYVNGIHPSRRYMEYCIECRKQGRMTS